MTRKVDAISWASLAAAVVGLACQLGNYHAAWLGAPLLILGLALFAVTARVLTVAAGGTPQGGSTSSDAAIVVRNSAFVTIDRNTSVGPGPVLDAQNVFGLRA